MDMRAARRVDELELDGEAEAEAEDREEAGHRQGPVRGIHGRDRLALKFE